MAADGRMGDSAWEGAGGGPLGLGGWAWDGRVRVFFLLCEDGRGGEGGVWWLCMGGGKGAVWSFMMRRVGLYAGFVCWYCMDSISSIVREKLRVVRGQRRR